MTYGYIRVSTDRQTVENQRFEIETLLSHVHKGDLIICSELSRLGRSLFMIMSILNLIMEKGARLWTIKDNYRLGDDIQSKVLAFAFGLSAEIERNLISQRTKEALERKKAEGIKLGRPRGIPNRRSKLDGAELAVSVMLIAGTNINQIARLYRTHRTTVQRFIIKRKLDSRENLERVRKMG